MVCLQILPEATQQKLILDRAAIQTGEWWRIFSAHFIHLSWLHLSFNLLMTIILWQFYGRLFSRLNWMMLIVLLSFTVSCGIFLFTPQLQQYAGFSGVLIGLFIAPALSSLKTQPWLSALICLAITIKILIEQLHGQEIISSSFSGIPTAVDAHLYGGLGGVLFYLMTVFIRAFILPSSKR